MKMFSDSILPAAGSVPGGTESVPFRLAAGIPPTITVQPAGDGYDGITAVTLEVTATGDAPLTYQWYEGESGDTSTPIEGATGASYEAAPQTETSYWCRVSNGVNPPADSDTATVTLDPPVITGQPSNGEYDGVTPVTLTVTATGAGLNYQWYEGESGTKDTAVVGATSASYDASPDEETQYWCEVSNEGGEVNSDAATVTVPIPTMLLVQSENQSDITAGAYNSFQDESGNGFDLTAAGTKATADSGHQQNGHDTILVGAGSSPYDSGVGVDQNDVFPSGAGTIVARIRVATYSNFFGGPDLIIGTYNLSANPIIGLKVTSSTNLRFGKLSSATIYAVNLTIALDTWYTVVCRWDDDVVKMKIVGESEDTKTDASEPMDTTSERIRWFFDADSGGHFQGNVDIVAKVDGMLDDADTDALLAQLGL